MIVFELRVIAGIFSPKLLFGTFSACPISQEYNINVNYYSCIWNERIKILISDYTQYHFVARMIHIGLSICQLQYQKNVIAFIVHK